MSNFVKTLPSIIFTLASLIALLEIVQLTDFGAGIAPLALVIAFIALLFYGKGNAD